MITSSKIWVRVALINLGIVALLGTVMRYKIGFEFPYFDQKYLQEAHSHFAFTGWITHTLFFLIVLLLRNNLGVINEKLYSRLIVANLITAYGMLISFIMQGYGSVSISFSTLSIIVAYVFSYFALKDISRLSPGHPAKYWLRAAIWFGIFSTVGTMVLSYMMATKQYDQTTYLGSIYFYLHFQYNGWFLFTCIGLFIDRIRHFNLNPKHVSYSFWMFFLSGVPTYFLSILWAKLPVWLYPLVVLAAIFQAAGWWYFLRMITSNLENFRTNFSKIVNLLFFVVAGAVTVKILLQLGSTFPAVSKLAFGFRPIVIAYLHLVLLLIVSVFLLTFLYTIGLIHQNRNSRNGLVIFTVGALANEVILAIQGIASFSYTVIPFANEMLFVAAFILLFGAVFLLTSSSGSAKFD